MQRLRLEDGRQLAYKTQLPPTAEPAFYASARSPLLVGHRDLGAVGGCHVLALEWIDAPPAADVTAAARLVGEIGGDPPVELDIGDEARWTEAVRWTVEKLVRLIDGGEFDSIELADVERIATWAGSAPVLRAIADGPRLVHGELNGDHVFATADGPKVIGWRRPLIGPPGLDLAAQWNTAVAGIAWFLRLRWAAIAQVEPWAAQAVAELRRPS